VMELVTPLDADVLPSVRLRREMDAQLAQGMRWSRQELDILEAACAAADRAAELGVLLAAELKREEPAVASVVRLSSELRLLERQRVSLVAMLRPKDVERPKSSRHQMAALSRWGREAR